MLAACGAANAGEQRFWGGWREAGRQNLTFAPDESDNDLLSMYCRIGSGRVTVLAPLRDGYRFRLSSGKVTRVYRSVPSDGELGDYRETTVPLTDPVLQAFSRSGVISIGSIGAANATTSRERREIAAFFFACAPRGRK